MDLRVGGKYRFTKKLGEGAFGSTYSGVNVKSNEEVAIKLVSLIDMLDIKLLIWVVFLNELRCYDQIFEN